MLFNIFANFGVLNICQTNQTRNKSCQKVEKQRKYGNSRKVPKNVKEYHGINPKKRYKKAENVSASATDYNKNSTSNKKKDQKCWLG